MLKFSLKLKESFKDDLIIKLCENKKVIHFGACDSPYTIEKAKLGILLHQKLMKICDEVLGLDIDQEAIKFLKNEYSINNIYYCDILDKKSVDIFLNSLKNKKYDWIIFGDIVEHLDSPGVALKHLLRISEYTNAKIIFTTPNVFNLDNFLTYIFGKENVHPDHFFWPSKKTMDRLLSHCGFKILEFKYVHHGGSEILDNNIKGILGELLLFKFLPHLRGTLFYILDSAVK